MGYDRTTTTDWDTYSKTTRADPGATYDSLYKNRAGIAGSALKEAYDPKKISIRESRDSDANPNSTPIIIALDGTGSMGGVLAEALKGVGALMAEIYDREPVSDPQVMFQVFQDASVRDEAPFQATQFESSKIIVDQVSELYIRQGGGGNDCESYDLPLYFAMTRTDCDAFKKGRKGYLFTVGDESVPRPLTTEQIRYVFGDDEPEIEPTPYSELLERVSENWDVFHIMVEQGSHMRSFKEPTEKAWRDVLGQRAIPLADITRLPEVIVATLQVLGGADKAAVAASFKDTGTALVVQNAIKDLTASDGAGITRFA